MKNRFLYILSVFIIIIFFISNSYSSEQFSFDVTNIEILENGNVFKGSNKGIIKTNDGLIIIADSFEYNKHLLFSLVLFSLDCRLVQSRCHAVSIVLD